VQGALGGVREGAPSVKGTGTRKEGEKLIVQRNFYKSASEERKIGHDYQMNAGPGSLIEKNPPGEKKGNENGGLVYGPNKEGTPKPARAKGVRPND